MPSSPAHFVAVSLSPSFDQKSPLFLTCIYLDLFVRENGTVKHFIKNTLRHVLDGTNNNNSNDNNTGV